MLSRNNEKLHRCINLTVFFTLFICYTLKFLYPPFYVLTDKWFGMMVFASEGILLLNSFDPIEAIKKKDKDFFFLIFILMLIAINLIVVKSGFGAYFTAANFVLIFYASNKLKFSKLEIQIMSGTYLAMLLFWLIVLYPSYFGSYDASFALNTNGAATFTVYTFFCAFVLMEDLFQKYKFMGVLIVIMFVRIIRLDLWHRARGAFIILTLFMLFYYLLPRKIWKSEKIITCLALLATVGSLMFVLIYTSVGLSGFNVFIPVFYKNIFSGRENIWYEFFTYFIRKPITGIGTNVEIKSFVEFNVHNAMYDILVVHGIVVFAGALYFVIKRFREFGKNILSSRLSLLGFVVLISVFFESYIDVDLIWADYALNLMFILAVTYNCGLNKDALVETE